MITFEDGHDFYYLKVSGNHALEAGEQEEAAPLFLVSSSNTFEDEFYIVYYEHMSSQRNGSCVTPSAAVSIPYYLEANPSLFGNNDGPLKFKPNADSRASEYRFKFEEPMNENNSVHQIMKEKKFFYLRCPRKWKMASYLYFSKTQSTGCIFRSGCTHSTERHDQITGFMLFQLQPFKPEDSPSTLPQPASTATLEEQTTDM